MCILDAGHLSSQSWAEVQSFRRHQDRGCRDQSRLYFAPDVNLNTGLFLGRCKTMPAYPRQNTDLTLDHFHGYFTAFPEPFLQRLVFMPTGGRASMHADAHSTSVSPTVRYRMPSAGSTARCNFLPAETIPPGSKLETHKAQDGPETYGVHKHSHPHPQVYAGSKMAAGGRRIQAACSRGAVCPGVHHAGWWGRGWGGG